MDNDSAQNDVIIEFVVTRQKKDNEPNGSHIECMQGACCQPIIMKLQSPEDEPELVCTKQNCHLKFKSEHARNKHVLKCKAGGNFICTECGNSFVSKSTLSIHLKSIHSETINFQCHICHQEFTQRGNLDRHLVVHYAEKPFKCDICNRQFKTKYYLKSHMTSHTGEKNFPCKYCNKRFSQQGALNRHLLIHKGTKPYLCIDCGARFSDISACRRHILYIHHKISRPKKVSLGVGKKTKVNCSGNRSDAIVQCQLCPHTCDTLKSLHSHLISTHQKYVTDVSLTSAISLQYIYKENDQLMLAIIQPSSSTSASDKSWVLRKQLVTTEEAHETTHETNRKEQVEVTSTVQESETQETSISISSSEYLVNPDLNQQEFYDWLAEFTQASQKFDMPLTQDLFQKINNLENTLSNMLASPEGFIRSKCNFVILLKTCEQLKSVCQKHLTSVMESLESE